MPPRPRILSLPIAEPGESEYSHGRGLSAPEERGHVTPLPVQHQAVFHHRMDPADPTATPDHNPQWVKNDGTVGYEPTPRLRETGPSKGGNNERSYPEGETGTEGG